MRRHSERAASPIAARFRVPPTVTGTWLGVAHTNTNDRCRRRGLQPLAAESGFSPGLPISRIRHVALIRPHRATALILARSQFLAVPPLNRFGDLRARLVAAPLIIMAGEDRLRHPVRDRIRQRLPSGATHEKPKIDRCAGSRNLKSSPALKGMGVSKPTHMVAKQVQLPERSHASPLGLPPTPVYPRPFIQATRATTCGFE